MAGGGTGWAQGQCGSAPAQLPASGEVHAARSPLQRQAGQQGSQTAAVQLPAAAAAQPVLQQQSLTGRRQAQQSSTIQLQRCALKRCQGQIKQLLLLLLLRREPFRLLADAAGGAGVQLLEHRQHVGTDTVAAQLQLRIGRVLPDGPALAAADPLGVLAGEQLQGPHQPQR